MLSTSLEGEHDFLLVYRIIVTVNFDYSYGFHCPVSYNPADYFIKILSQAENQITKADLKSSDSEENLFDLMETNQSERAIDSFILKQCQKYATDYT